VVLYASSELRADLLRQYENKHASGLVPNSCYAASESDAKGFPQNRIIRL